MRLLFSTLRVGAFFAALFILPAFHYWRRLGEDGLTVEEWRLFRRWVCTGTLVPFALWVFCNTGFLMPPVWPTVVPISAGLAKWENSCDELVIGSAFVILSYWAGITFAWLLVRVFVLAASRRNFFILCGVWSILLGPLALAVLAVGGWGALGVALMLALLPLVHLALNLRREAPPLPSYSRALAKINFGKYDEAERAVLAELEQCEEDFDGWMRLAELYATHFDDLPGADRTVRDLCAQPATTPVQLSIALQKLADWHLKIGHDPVRARQALEEICARAPGTHLDKMARQRFSQLPSTRQELRKREEGQPLHLPHVPDEMEGPVPPILPREEAAAAANESVARLVKNPDDVAAREKFARLLAESLGDAPTAIEQLELLLAMPDQPTSKRGEWLLTKAAWHARYRDDFDTAKLVYQEVMRDFPSTTQAFAAQRRLSLIDLQAQSRRRFAERARVAV